MDGVSMYYTASGVLIMGRVGTLPVPPSLLANVVLRLVLCPVAVLLTWVPLKMLWRNGEFPACVFLLDLWLLIFFVFVNAALWHNQDFDSWWLGYGWCDMQAYVQYALVTVYSTSVCAIMQRLSSQVGITRVTGLSVPEKRRRLVYQSLIIFPVPVLQIIITIFVQGQRYGIAPATGCANEYEPTVVFLVFFILPPLLFTMAACFHTFQTYRKFRQVDSSSQAALHDTNSVAFARRQRARRKLYFMVLCILVPYTPLITAFAVIGVIEGWPWNYPSDYWSVHFNGPVPWNSISVLGYQDIGFLNLNMSWIPVISAFVAFVFFGTSKEAINIYRTYLLALGLGRVFPKLREPYDPDRTQFDSTTSNTSNATTLFSTTESASQSRKGSSATLYPSAASGVGGVAQARPSRISALFYRVFGKKHAPSPCSADVELGSNAPPVPLVPSAASAALSRSPFNPGLHWFLPPDVLPKPHLFVSWKKQGKRGSASLAAGQDAEARTACPPTSSASTTPTVATAASTAPMLVPGRTTRPFDGTRTNSMGGRALSTHVWSDGDPLPASTASLGRSPLATGLADGRTNKSRNDLGDQPQQQGVRIERCITTTESTR